MARWTYVFTLACMSLLFATTAVVALPTEKESRGWCELCIEHMPGDARAASE
ncbi:hypothetical protein F5879DRAFT_989146 [Lentinula edodes]|nr:hypothetical protein F5879DRAFT_989146 [Lentinula edodes]